MKGNNDVELKITNDNFLVEISDNKQKKIINASYDIFDYDDKECKEFINGYTSMGNEFFKGNFDNEFTMFYISLVTNIPEITKKQITNSIIREDSLKYSGNFLFSDNNLPNYEKQLNKLWKDYQNNSNDIITIYKCNNNKDIIVSCLIHFINAGRTIVKCSRCGRYFIPTKRNDTKYCDRIDLLTNKTCKELNTYQKQLENSKEEEKKIYKSVYNTIRNKYGSQSNEMNTFMINAQMWKDKLKNKTITKKEYIDWLKSHYQFKHK